VGSEELGVGRGLLRQFALGRGFEILFLEFAVLSPDSSGNPFEKDV
jgi:hypothetical protein